MGTGTRVLRSQIEEALDEGASLDDVDREIVRAAPLSPELRSALWLYAWGLSERDGQPPAAVERLRS